MMIQMSQCSTQTCTALTMSSEVCTVVHSVLDLYVNKLFEINRLSPGPTARILLERSLNGRERGPNFDNACHRAKKIGENTKIRTLP